MDRDLRQTGHLSWSFHSFRFGQKYKAIILSCAIVMPLALEGQRHLSLEGWTEGKCNWKPVFFLTNLNNHLGSDKIVQNYFILFNPLPWACHVWIRTAPLAADRRNPLLCQWKHFCDYAVRKVQLIGIFAFFFFLENGELPKGEFCRNTLILAEVCHWKGFLGTWWNFYPEPLREQWTSLYFPYTLRVLWQISLLHPCANAL